MGPCLWGTEYIDGCVAWLMGWGASMGPCLWGTEYPIRSKTFSGNMAGFNGAVPLGHGILVPSHRDCRRFRCFNGAVPLGHGILPCDLGSDVLGIASMGPCLWGTEYVRDHRQRFAAMPASMGPCLWGTEYGHCRAESPVGPQRFNGAVPLGHGILVSSDFLRPRIWGFNGAVPLGHGIRKALDNLGVSIVASMGPCLWGTEYSFPSWPSLHMGKLQWGRAFGARNTLRSIDLPEGRLTGFNGAVPLGHGIQNSDL